MGSRSFSLSDDFNSSANLFRHAQSYALRFSSGDNKSAPDTCNPPLDVVIWCLDETTTIIGLAPHPVPCQTIYSQTYPRLRSIRLLHIQWVGLRQCVCFGGECENYWMDAKNCRSQDHYLTALAKYETSCFAKRTELRGFKLPAAVCKSPYNHTIRITLLLHSYYRSEKLLSTADIVTPICSNPYRWPVPIPMFLRHYWLLPPPSRHLLSDHHGTGPHHIPRDLAFGNQIVIEG